MERLSIDEIIAHCERKVERIEKYNNGVNTIETASIDLPIVKEYWEHKQVAEYLKELKSYRDAEEQGLLLRLPCKVGDTVYFIYHNVVCHSQVRRFYQCNGAKNWGIILWDAYPDLYFDQFGKTCFLTKEEAEQKLASMQKGE